MSIQVCLPLTREAFCLDPLRSALSRRNVWFDDAPAAPHAPLQADPLDLRWLCFAVDEPRLDALLAELSRGPAAVEAEVHPNAAIARLYPDGRVDWTAVVQVECVLRADRIEALLDRLQGRGLLDHSWDRVTIVRPLHAAADSACQVLPAETGSPYSHLVRWRERPGRSRN